MARDIHPLFATRGPPGTHDVHLGRSVLKAFDAGEAVPLPRFDKATDDPADPATWPLMPQPCPLLIFEGWCVGARPQPDDALAEPVNALEREEDRDGIWRRHANAALGDYRSLFDRIDILVLLQPPAFESVLGWRMEQERKLRESRGSDGTGVMSDAQIAHFIAHYERLTRHIMREMPSRADLVLRLNHARQCA